MFSKKFVQHFLRQQENHNFPIRHKLGDNEYKFKMCGTTAAKSGDSTFKLLSGVLAVTTIGLLVSTIVLGTKKQYHDIPDTNVPSNTAPDVATIFSKVSNKCDGAKPKPGGAFDNYDCIHVKGPQAGANVTKGFKGLLVENENVTVGTPLLDDFWESKMCTVNVHWHLGTEHYSVGEYDEKGTGPNGGADVPYRQRGLAETVRGGFRCHHYNKDDEKFTKEYDWKHCIGMEVGETYEVHWPNSIWGACGTVDQYQTPFEDGVLCNLGSSNGTLDGLDQKVGVQAQIYTVVNDESYFYPDMIRSWIKDQDYGKDIARYTGSTTGTSRSNTKCSAYAPITWQVDRKCHMISASSFDKLCYDMKLQRDSMKDDLHAHGSRELVKPSLVANNQQTRRLGNSHEHVHDIPHYHGHEEEHDHEHDHEHQEWF